MTEHTFSFTVTSVACPFEIFGSVNGHTFWYRQRSQRWELYATTFDALNALLDAPTASVDAQGHLAGPGLSWLAEGLLGRYEEEGELAAALARITRHVGDDSYLADELDQAEDDQADDAPFTVVDHVSPFLAGCSRIEFTSPSARADAIARERDAAGPVPPVPPVAGYLHRLKWTRGWFPTER